MLNAPEFERSYPLWRPVDLSKTPNEYHKNLGMKDFEKVIDQAGAMVGYKRAADSTSVGPLIRQDLDPKIYELFVKKFPFFDMIGKVPANGLVHAYDQQTGFGDALFITELGTVTDDANTYVRATANIAVLATRRGISLKAQFAVQAGGMAFDPEAREIAGGLNALRNKTQAAMFRYQDVDNTSITATAPNGLYDANAFNGMRYIMQNIAPAGNTISVDVTGAYTPASQAMLKGIRAAANVVIDAGGEPDMVIGTIGGREFLLDEMLPLVRVTSTTEVIPGLTVPKVVAGEAELPIITIPGSAAGIGTILQAAHTYVDMYVVDSSLIEWAYLGGPTPTILEIPTGVDGTLRKLYIPFLMGGLVCYAPLFMSRVQIKIA